MKKGLVIATYMGSAKDNCVSPVHRWFGCPAGFSYHLVREILSFSKIKKGQVVLDPFVGCGTTAVEAKKMGIDCVGIEANPLVWWVAKTKCFWEYDLTSLINTALSLANILNRNQNRMDGIDVEHYPALVHKSYSPENLRRLAFIQRTIREFVREQERDFFELALISILRRASRISSGWSYIALSEHHRKRERDAVRLFEQQVMIMIEDLKQVRERLEPGRATILLADARCEPIADECVDLVITSPPYLNNYDYAEQSRLEMYFMGQASSWREIATLTKNLIVSATSQVARASAEKYQIDPRIRSADLDMYWEIDSKVSLLREIRKNRRGRKNYDLVVSGYINDMFRVMKEVYRVLKPGGMFAIVVGDSAPYGVYIPTEEYIKRLGIIAGFETLDVLALRQRGNKWKNNPIRHHVNLKEVLLILQK